MSTRFCVTLAECTVLIPGRVPNQSLGPALEPAADAELNTAERWGKNNRAKCVYIHVDIYYEILHPC